MSQNDTHKQTRYPHCADLEEWNENDKFWWGEPTEIHTKDVKVVIHRFKSDTSARGLKVATIHTLVAVYSPDWVRRSLNIEGTNYWRGDDDPSKAQHQATT